MKIQSMVASFSLILVQTVIFVAVLSLIRYATSMPVTLEVMGGAALGYLVGNLAWNGCVMLYKGKSNSDVTE